MFVYFHKKVDLIQTSQVFALYPKKNPMTQVASWAR